jgi:hypothetical protein
LDVYDGHIHAEYCRECGSRAAVKQVQRTRGVELAGLYRCVHRGILLVHALCVMAQGVFDLEALTVGHYLSFRAVQQALEL